MLSVFHLKRTCKVCVFSFEKISCDYFSEKILNRLLFDLCFWLYLCFGVSSLCLYIITIFFVFQDGILYNITILYLYKLQICVYKRQFLLTLHFRYDTITMLGGLWPGRPFSYFCCSSQIRSTAMSAGLTPEMRPACPMDMGRISASFSLASSRRPTMEL